MTEETKSVETSKERRKRRNKKEWRMLLREQSKSGQSIERFCKLKDIAEGSFYKWRRTFKEEEKVGQFVKMNLDDGSKEQAKPWKVELDFGDGRVLRFK